MARPVIATALVALLFALGGCGAESDDPRPREPERDLLDLERQTVDKATKAELEQFAEVRIPASATNLRSASRSAMDTQVIFSFRVPNADLDAFIRSGHFRTKLVENNRAISTSFGEKIGWRLDEAERIEGLSDSSRPGLYRNLVVVLDDPERPAVYVEAATL